jgi:ABC-2 type transport system ATP-binding protein
MLDPTPRLRCTSLSKSFGDRVAVDGVSFTISPGECYGLLGPNGAGKTTTISMVCGVLRPDGGRVEIEGCSPTGPDAQEARRLLGYVPQGVALFPELSVAENVDFWARLTGVPRRRRRERTETVLEQVGLADRARDTVASCSGGMQRRANLAVALVHDPALLVLDEPTVGVDPQSRHRLLDLVESITASGTSVLYTSHYMEEVARVADRVGIMDAGRLVAEGTLAELLDASPAGVADLEARFLELTGTALRD